MKRVPNNYDFTLLERTLYNLDADHSYSKLNTIKTELSRMFNNLPKCNGVLFTENTDKFFFGMKCYINITSTMVDRIMGDNTIDDNFIKDYFIEIDSKLYDPMLDLSSGEMMAILLHEIGHIAINSRSIDEVRKAVDIYYTKSGTSYNPNCDYRYKELLAYALKDSVMKVGSIFNKIGDEEIMADSFVASCGYGPHLETAMRKISRNSMFIDKTADKRLITLSWVIRMGLEFNVKRLPAIHTLNKAKELTASTLEKNEIDIATKAISQMKNPLDEAAVMNEAKNVFSQKWHNFKIKSIMAIRNEIYELNLRLRCAESEEDLMFIIREANTNISILEDALSSEELSDGQRKEINQAIFELYDIRQKAAKDKKVRDRYSSYIQVYYPD